jgi:hypothetical protein
MATVTGLTAERMLEIEAESIVDGIVNGLGHLILTRHDGTTIDAGYIVDNTNNMNLVGDQTATGNKIFSNRVSVGGTSTAGSQLSVTADAVGTIGIISKRFSSGSTADLYRATDELNGVLWRVAPSGHSQAVGDVFAQYGLSNQARMGIVGSGAASGVEFGGNANNFIGTTALNVVSIAAGGQTRASFDANGIKVGGYNPNTTHQSSIATANSQIIGSRGFAVNADGQAYQGGVTVGLSIGIGRVDPAVSICNSNGELIYGHNGATKTLGITKDGGITSLGVDNRFGTGAFGAAGGFVQLASDGATAYVTGMLTAGNGGLNVRSQGTGEIKLQGNAGGAPTDVVRLSVVGGAPKIGFLGSAPIVKPAVAGSRAANAALASLITQLANLGLITDTTTA